MVRWNIIAKLETVRLPGKITLVFANVTFDATLNLKQQTKMKKH